MKIKPTFFVLTFLIIIVIVGHSTLSWGRTRLEQKHLELIEFVGTPEALAEQKEWKFRAFIREVMPELIAIDKQFGIEKQLKGEERIEDVMAFAYEIARERLYVANKAYVKSGYWSEDPELMRKEVGFLARILCFARWVFMLKPEKYNTQMANTRPILYDGAYARLIVSLSLKDLLFTASEETIKVEGVPSVENLVTLNTIQMLKKVQK